ncbi:MAG: hypothetical protein WCI73_05200, partial [Phycisphaerae bacterium]
PKCPAQLRPRPGSARVAGARGGAPLPLRPEQPRPAPIRLPRSPVLRFTPTAWAKLQFFCHAGDTEVGGFAVSSPDDPLLVLDFVTVHQRVSCITVAFDDDAVADFFDVQVDLGRKPEQFARCWLHTHPGNSPTPSMTDEETFGRVFGSCDWAIMAIVARGGQTYARLRFNLGPGGQIVIPLAVDYQVPFAASDHEAWTQEYLAHIHPEVFWETLESPRDPRLPRQAYEKFDRSAAASWELAEDLEELAARGLLDESDLEGLEV